MLLILALLPAALAGSPSGYTITEAAGELTVDLDDGTEIIVTETTLEVRVNRIDMALTAGGIDIYGESNGAIAVSVEEDGDEHALTVTDRGTQVLRFQYNPETLSRFLMEFPSADVALTYDASEENLSFWVSDTIAHEMGHNLGFTEVSGLSFELQAAGSSAVYTTTGISYPTLNLVGSGRANFTDTDIETLSMKGDFTRASMNASTADTFDLDGSLRVLALKSSRISELTGDRAGKTTTTGSNVIIKR